MSKKSGKVKLILLLLLAVLACAAVAACKKDNAPALSFTKDIPQRVTYMDQIYFKDYIPLEYGEDYTLTVSYHDNKKNEDVTDKKLDSLLFVFDNVTDYTFKLQRTGGGNVLTASVSCYPELPELSESQEYTTVKNDTLLLTDLLFWCGLSIENEEAAEADPGFKWVFEKAVVKTATVDGEDREIDLSESESFTFSDEAVYEFSVKAVNKAGAASAVLVCNTSDTSKHGDAVTGYAFNDSEKLEFSVPAMTAPANGATVKTRIGKNKYDAVYNAASETYTISDFTEELENGVKYRIYVTSPDSVAYSTLAVVPDLVVYKNNVTALQVIKDGYAVLAEDIDMKDITYGSLRNGLDYKEYWFKGTFDGRGHTVSNFTTGSASFAGGLFWSADGATFKNVTFENAVIKGSNSVLVGRAKNLPSFENIAVEVAEMNMNNSGVVAGPSESNIGYKDILMYVRKNTSGEIKGSGFMGGAYARSVVIDNVHAVTSTQLPLGPVHASIETAGTDSIKTYTAKEAKNKLCSDNLGTTLLNEAAKKFFSGEVEADPGEEPKPTDVTEITQSNIGVLQTATVGTFKLTADIDMTDVSAAWNPTSTFSGTLDGQGYKISNFTTPNVDVDSKKAAYGFFKTLSGATIKNVVFDKVFLRNKSLFSTDNLTANVNFENVFINITQVHSNSYNGYRYSVLGYHTSGTATLKNVFINMPANTNDQAGKGFLTTHAAKDEILDGVYCVGGNGELHSPAGSGLPNNANLIPNYLKADGATAAAKGTDYFIYDDALSFYISNDYKTAPEFIKTAFASVFSAELANVVELTKNNFREKFEFVTTAESAGKYYVLTEDIDMTGITDWRGNIKEADGETNKNYKDYYFSGTLDGNGHTISNFTTIEVGHQGGLLWCIGNGTVKNLIMKNVTVRGVNAPIAGRAGNKQNNMNTISKLQNVAVEIAAMDMSKTAGALFTASEFNCTFENVLVYVKSNGGTSVNAGAGFAGSVYSQSIIADGLYCVTDTTLALTPAHASITTQIKNSNGEAAAENTDYFKWTTEQAKSHSADAMPTQLLKDAFTSFFTVQGA